MAQSKSPTHGNRHAPRRDARFEAALALHQKGQLEEAPRLARHLEQVFVTLHERRLAGRPAEDIAIGR